MAAFAVFLFCVSFFFGLLSFYPQLAPENPKWLNQLSITPTNMFVAAGVFIIGLEVLLVFG